ncbi:MAG: hypothetical protein HZC41_02250 [Chloroflexi bacterium]|nr:hypothetical protein [Chloroflexota bacterium]
MSEQPPVPPNTALSNPQVIAAIIGGIVTVVVAIVGIVPAIINSQRATPVVVTATPVPLTTVAVVLLPPPTATLVAPSATVPPTSAQVELTPIVYSSPTTEAVQPTPIFPSATATPAAPPVQTGPTNVLLMYDDVSFTMLNQDTRTLSFEGVAFRSSAGEWEARRWGPSIYNSLKAGMCLRLRDASVGQRQPPAPCVNKIYGLQEVGTPAIFWRNVERFDVVRNGQVIATCAVADQQCAIAVP